jgi:hypothetical protein
MIRRALGSAKSVQPFARAFSAAVELREYSLKPSRAAAFQKLANASGALRKQLAPLRLFATSDAGGELNTVFHFYYHTSLQSRADAARGLREHAQWSALEGDAAQCCDKQSCNIYAEAPFVAESYGGMATEHIAATDRCPAIYELRRYRLVLGYDTVPRFMDCFSSGLSSKLLASHEAGSRFCSLLYTEVGSLNEVVELWRHNGVSGMEQARVLSRQSQPWKKAVARIAPLALSFSNTLLTPAPFSNWC